MIDLIMAKNIGVIVFLNDSWNYTQSDRDIDIMQMYKETVKGLNANIFIIIDNTTSGMVHRHSDLELKCETYKTLGEALGRYPKFTKFYFEHPNAIPDANHTTLEKLEHPKDDVLYVFGSDVGGLNVSDLKLGKNDKVVSINVSRYILWAIVAMTMALYDRHVKLK